MTLIQKMEAFQTPGDARPNGARAWMLDKVEDDQGNSFCIYYDKDEWTFRPRQITYGCPAEISDTSYGLRFEYGERPLTDASHAPNRYRTSSSVSNTMLMGSGCIIIV